MAEARRPSLGSRSSASASDDDRSEVEVMFDPTSPYRRKSSMVSSAGIPSHFRRASRQQASRKTECLVHQLLESQRHPSPDQKRHGTGAVDLEVRDGEEDLEEVDGNTGDYPHVQVSDDSGEQGHHRVLDPKGKEHGKLAVCDAVHKGISAPNGQMDGEEEQANPKAVAFHDVFKQFPSQSPLHRSRTASSTISETDSRLLTKKQLIEMAWGVRELSRRLGSVRLRFKVKNIFILTKPYDNDLIPKAREVARWLLSKEQEIQYTVYVDQKFKDDRHFGAEGLINELAEEYGGGDGGDEQYDKAKARLRFWDENMCRTRPQTFDFVVSLGGDGTVLYASWLFQRIVPPVLSFALGSLGFLTKFDFEKYQETLTGAFKEGVSVSLRLRFEATVMRSKKLKSRPDGDAHADGNNHTEDEDEAHRKRDLVDELIGEEKDDEHTHHPEGTYEVLNELVVDRGPNPTMSFTEIFGDDEHFTSILADGVCVSTPTGSTAYNLAAGGSLCHPDNPVMLVTAICAHTLSFRPIILPDTIVLRIGVPYDARTSSWASFDGRERIELKQGDYVTISASRYPFAAVQPPGRRGEDWINSISAKLGWNTRQKQKPFKGKEGEEEKQ
ncbi:ATP NAD kinase [Naviculisporaceae sp. PSN 640]